ncbi:hypothetical protein DV736_g1357, partial [Chaetothyriales sp. CBS 134916]
MSLGFGFGDFLAVIELAKDIRSRFVDAPDQFKAISIEVKSLLNVLRDIEDLLDQRDLSDQQKTELSEIVQGCRGVLEDLEKILDKYQELDPTTKGFTGRSRRVWKRLRWDQSDIDGFRSRVTSNISMLNVFLLAQLHFDSVIYKSSPKKIKIALEKLRESSDTYDNAYHDAMNRIEGQVQDFEDLAKRVLSWITCAKRPLTTLELQHALGVEIDEPELDLDNLPDIEDMVSDEYGETPLSWAALQGHEVVVKLLLEKGAELDSKDEYGETPLSWAALQGHEVVVKLLLEKGAELDSKSKSGQTPLSWAAQGGHEAVVKLLLEKGAELDSKSKSGQTPLSRAAQGGHEAVVKLLLEKGAELDSKDKSGQTPLSWAALQGHEVVVKLLLEKGAELDSKSKSGQTPLSWAAQGGHEAVVKLLLEKGAELDSKDKYNRTPLSQAAERGHEAVVKLLSPTTLT